MYATNMVYKSRRLLQECSKEHFVYFHEGLLGDGQKPERNRDETEEVPKKHTDHVVRGSSYVASKINIVRL